MHRLVLAGLALLLGAAPLGAQPRLVVTPETTVETVFRWQNQRCQDMHLPDSPARALRMRDGGIALFAAHLINIPMLGRDFASLSPVCAMASRGAESADPTAFQDRFWVQALVPFGPRGQVLGLTSHEFMGWRHPGRCQAAFEGQGRRGAAFRCWYSSITAVVADQGDWHFLPVPPPRGVIAASPAPFDPTRTSRTGFFSITNALIEEGHATVMVYTEGVEGQRRGMCLLRAPLAELPDGWRAESGGAFALSLGPNRPESPACDVVGANVFGPAPVRSVIRLAGPGGPWYAAVFTRAAPPGQASPTSDGIFYSLSRDLRQWSRAERLLAATPFRSQPEAGVYVEYPSLIDHASPSPVFDRTAEHGAEIHLYLTRFNLQDRRRGLDRDLVRIAVRLEGG